MPKKYVKYVIISIMVATGIFLSAMKVYAINAHNLQSYNNFCVSGMIKGGNNMSEESDADANLLLSFDARSLMFRQNGIMKIGEYTDREIVDPYEVSGPGEPAIKCVYNDRIYKVIGKRGTVDDSYKYEEWDSNSEKMRRKFEVELEALLIGYRGEAARGFGKYNLRVEKNLVPFLNYANRFYRTVDFRHDKTQEEINSHSEFDEGTMVAEFEELKNYQSKNAVNTEMNKFNEAFKKFYNYEICVINNQSVESISGQSVFETLQDMFMALVYLKPALKELKGYYREEFSENINNLTDIDRAAIISMAYDKFSDRVIANGDNDDNLTITMKVGDIYFPLINYKNLSVAERIYHYMIEIKYANNPDMQARWLAEANEMLGSFGILSAEEYEKFYKAYLEAQKKYAKHRSPATAYDYGGEVLTPEDFESTHKFDEARDKLSRYLRSKFSNSSFFRDKDNADIAARNYMIVSKMVDDAAFSDITEVYCSDVELVTHSYGYSSNEIMLSDFIRAELAGDWGTDTDTDEDGLNDNIEAYAEELVDISEFVENYCEYNHIEGEEKERYMRDYGTVKVYNYKSNPVLPDTDFDGRNDARDAGRPFNNDYKIKTKSNGRTITVDFNMDYRYFFMKSSDYYAELSRMSAMLANAILKDNNEAKAYNVLSDHYDNAGIVNYMYWLGMEYGTYYEDNNETPFAFGHHEVKYLNNSRDVIAIVIGENEETKDTLASNYDSGNYIHSGFLSKAEYIYEKLKEHNSTSGDNKVYWITGYGTGGSVANIVADKLIDDVGAESVYCYTYGAISTINTEAIPEREVVSNAKNVSIFNLINIDDLSLLTLGKNWELYGRYITFTLSDDSKVKKEYNKMVSGNLYNIILKSMRENLKIFNDLLNDISELTSSAFGWKSSDGAEKIEESNKLASNIAAYIASTIKEKVEGKITAYDYFGDILDSIVSGFIGTQVNKTSSPMYISNIDDIRSTSNNEEGIDAKDGYRFLDMHKEPLNYNKFNRDIITNNDNAITIKANNDNFVYSNWTLDDTVFCDIDFTKFWNVTQNEQQIINATKNMYENENASHMHLFDIGAGDFGKGYNNNAGKTLTTYSGYSKSANTKKLYEDLGYNDLEGAVNNSDGVVEYKHIKNGNTTVGEFIVVDGRIVAAFPYAALVGENSEDYKVIGNKMHEFDNYNHLSTDNQGRFKGWGNNGGKDSIYRYVDVVFEKDGDKKHQYVIPFIIVSVKDLHYMPFASEGHNAAFVDNRYGQVYMQNTNMASLNKNAVAKTDDDLILYKDSAGKNQYVSSEHTHIADEWGWQKMYYPHRDEIRNITRLSPIEPYIKVIGGVSNTLVRDSLLLTPKDKIVCMRVYNHKFDVNDARHFLDRRDDTNIIKNDNPNPSKQVLNETEQKVIRNVIIDYSQ